MADVTVKILTPATSFALMTLDELKTALAAPTGTQASDDQWQWLIDVNSATISELCNRVFAKEEVEETWRDVQNGQRIYLSHYPVVATDIESVTTNGGDRLDYELEETSGKLQIFTNWVEPVVVTYTGGFDLPDDAPMPLKQALTLLAATWKAQLAMVQVTGVRMIAHKEARVMFHTPATINPGAGGAHPGIPPAVDTILSQYTRFWV
jgi:hypothetical protein